MSQILLRTKDKEPMYVHGIHGVLYLTWVQEHDRTNALLFPYEKREEWQSLIEDIAKHELEIVTLAGTVI